MRLKTLVLTVAALAVLTAIVAFVRRPAPAPSADPRLGQPVVEASIAEKAAKLHLSDAGKSVDLVREADGTWRVTSYYDLPADFQKLSRLVGDLNEAKLQRLVTTNPERIARLEFKDTQIALRDAADKELVALTLGKHADTGGRFVRFGDETKAYLANLNAWLDSEAKNWADAELLHLKPDDIAKIELAFPEENTAVTLSRAKKEDTWTAAPAPEGQRLNAGKVASTLSSLASLRFTDTKAPDDPAVAAAKAHERTLKLTTFDNKTYTVTFARTPEQKKLKPPAPSADGKSGPAALGSVSDLAKKETSAATSADSSKSETPNADASAQPKPLEPEYETIPAGPVFVSVASSDTNAPINAEMKKRAFQVSDYVYTGLPQKAADLFEPAPTPPPPAPAKADGKPADAPKKE